MKLIARILMGLLGLALLAVLLLGLLGYIVYATVRWLLTGRKPQVVLVWQQFSAMRRGFGAGGFRAASGQGFYGTRGPHTAYHPDDPDHQVVDVQVREVLQDPPRLPPRQQG